MTKFKDALDYWDRWINEEVGTNELVRLQGKEIRLALRIAQAVTEEPSIRAQRIGQGEIYEYRSSAQVFRAMIEQMMREIGDE